MLSSLMLRIEIEREEDGRWTIEMVHGVYQAQKTGSRVSFPLQSRDHALQVIE